MSVAEELPLEIQSVLKKFRGQLVLAGGFVRDVLSGRKPKDIDLFLLEPSVNDEVMRAIHQAVKTRASDKPGGIGNALTWKAKPYDVQLIRGPWKTSYDVLNSFDFTICQHGIMCDDDGVLVYVSTPDGERDLGAGVLRWTGKQIYPGASLRRMVKFAAAGFEVPPETIRDVAEAAGVTDTDVLDQIDRRSDS